MDERWGSCTTSQTEGTTSGCAIHRRLRQRPTPSARVLGPTSDIAHPTSAYFTRELILKIGRIIAMAMKPTTEPMRMIMMGSIMLVTALIFSRSCFW